MASLAATLTLTMASCSSGTSGTPDDSDASAPSAPSSISAEQTPEDIAQAAFAALRINDAEAFESLLCTPHSGTTDVWMERFGTFTHADLDEVTPVDGDYSVTGTALDLYDTSFPLTGIIQESQDDSGWCLYHLAVETEDTETPEPPPRGEARDVMQNFLDAIARDDAESSSGYTQYICDIPEESAVEALADAAAGMEVELRITSTNFDSEELHLSADLTGTSATMGRPAVGTLNATALGRPEYCISHFSYELVQ